MRSGRPAAIPSSLAATSRFRPGLRENAYCTNSCYFGGKRVAALGPRMEDTIGRWLDAYGETHGLIHVAAEDPKDHGVPPDMRVGPVDAEGWVSWRVQSSTLRRDELRALAASFHINLPTHLEAFLCARAHLFDQARSKRHDQLLLLPTTPTWAPIRDFAKVLSDWRPLLRAGFVPFGEWGDGWGPICIDVGAEASTPDDGPVVWFDHESLHDLGPESCNRRALVEPLAQPLYSSLLELLQDVFEAP